MNTNAFLFGQASMGDHILQVHECVRTSRQAYPCRPCRPFFYNQRLYLAHWWYSPGDAQPKVLQGISRVDTSTLQVAVQSYS